MKKHTQSESFIDTIFQEWDAEDNQYKSDQIIWAVPPIMGRGIDVISNQISWYRGMDYED